MNAMRLGGEAGAKQDKFSELVLAIVESDPFRLRRGREPEESAR
jgi:hypothetical protein